MSDYQPSHRYKHFDVRTWLNWKFHNTRFIILYNMKRRFGDR